jgi:hypothetical protein
MDARFKQLYDSEAKLVQDYKDFQDALARNASAESLAELRAKSKKDALAFQEARQQISQDDFMNQRALTQGAASRGLGGSGLEQLARTQQRMQTGKQISGLTEAQTAGSEETRAKGEAIQNRLTSALSGSALQQQMGTIAAQEKMLGREQTMSTEQDANFQALFGGLAAATSEDEIKLLETYYKGRVPDELLNQALAGARTRIGATTTQTTSQDAITAAGGLPAGELRSYNLTPEQRENPEIKAAFDQDAATDNDGKIVNLKIGEKDYYFGDDNSAAAFLKQFFGQQRDIDQIEITVEKGVPKFEVKVPGTSNKQKFNTLSEAQNYVALFRTPEGKQRASVISGAEEVLTNPKLVPGFSFAENFSNWLQGIFSGQNQGEGSGSQLNNLLGNLGKALTPTSTFNKDVQNIRMINRKK